MTTSLTRANASIGSDQDAPRAAIYCRISDDRQGLGLGVQRQQEDCEALARRNGWQVTRRYIDNDISAYSGKPRPQYAALIAAVEAGEVDVVVAWHPDRLHRSPMELEHFIPAIERAGVQVATVQAGNWDLSTGAGQMIARVLGAVAANESRQKSERVRRALQQRATAGQPHGRRAYGWTREHAPDGTMRETVVPAEAAVVRRIADALLSGESLRAVTAALNEDGVPSPTGKPWAKGMVRALVLRERNAGIRIHRGVEAGAGAWEPILDRGRWEQLRAVLTDPTRKTSTGTAAKHLLSGIARCGVCGATLRMARNRGVDSYGCAERRCVMRKQADLDGLINGIIVARLARPDAVDLFTTGDTPDQQEALAEAEELRGRLDDAADQYADGKIDGRQLERITARLRPQLDAAEARTRTVDSAPLLDGLAGNPEVRELWDRLPLSRRRAVVAVLLDVRLHRTRRGARAFDPAAVEVTWKGAD
ncbi:recombinase family protein [Blastococcus sp. SYSU DS0669]